MHFVCVHGVCHGGWCWEKTREDLQGLGHQVTSPDLPLTSLEDDANAVRQALDNLSGPVVLVGHSYGGLVISKAALERSDLAHLVYVAAIMVGENQLFKDIAGDHPSVLNEHMVFLEDGASFEVASDGAIQAFYHCCDPETAASAVSRLRPTSMACLSSPSGAEPWHEIPSTYVLCQQDQAIAATLQQLMSKRAGHVVELDTDHSPFYSSRNELAAVLCGAAEATAEQNSPKGN